MPLDPSILAQGKPFQAPDPLQNYAKVLQIQGAQQQLQNAGIQQQVSQMQLEDMQRDRVEMVKFQQELASQGKDPDLRKYAQMLLSSPKHFQTGVELLQKLDGQDKLNAIMGGGTTNALAPATAAAAPTTAPVNALAKTALPAPGMRGGMPGGMPEAAPPGTPVRTAPARPIGAAAAPIQGAVPQEAQVLLNKIDQLYRLGTPQAINIAKGLEAQLKFYETTPAQKATDAREQQRIALEQRRVELAEKEAKRKESGVTELKPLTEAQTIKLRTDVAKDYKSATTALSQMDDLLNSIQQVRTAPGLSAATGYTGKYLPSRSEGAAAQAETRLANLRGKVTALGKATAAMSGSIGSIANQEWKILADQIAVLDEVKGKEPLLEQIDLVETQAKGAIERIRDAYEKTRAEDFERFPQFRDLPKSKAPGASAVPSNIDALLNKYK